jgi:hypothetical protein
MSDCIDKTGNVDGHRASVYTKRSGTSHAPQCLKNRILLAETERYLFKVVNAFF